jgi:hypothetical protein
MTKDEALRLALEALEKLWNIIDDIDTYSDMAKADEKLYRSLVERRQRQRFEETGILTDGYELHGGAITAIKVALETNEFNPDWDTQAVLVEEIQRMAKRIEELEAKDEPYALEASMFSNDRVKVDPVTGNVSIGTPQQEANDALVQVSPLQFVEMVMEKEHLVGKPIFWAEWPNKEKNT